MKIIPLTIVLGLFISLATPTCLSAQNLPAVFHLGDQEAAYEQLNQNYARTLPTVANNDLKQGLAAWYRLLRNMETYSEQVNVDLKGVKLWLHVFWNANGAIDHIGYFLLPDSRNIPDADLRAFLSSFIRQYTPELRSDKNFSHYTSVTFPTFAGTNGK